MFRTRLDELSDLITLHQQFSQSEFEPLIDVRKSFEYEIETLKTFLERDIESLSTMVIENMIEIEAFDSEFAKKVYELDQELFQKVFKNAIHKFYGQIGFEATIRIVRRVTYFHQAIMGYEAIYDQIKMISNHSKESYELSKEILKQIAKPLYPKLRSEHKTRVIFILMYLPLQAEYLPESSRLLIINLGSNDYLDLINDAIHIFAELRSYRQSWTVHRNIEENVFEIESNHGCLLCAQRTGEIHFQKRGFEMFSKLKLEYYDKDDPSKGYTIRFQDFNSNMYLCGNSDGRRVFVKTFEPRDFQNDAYFIWKFQCIEPDVFS